MNTVFIPELDHEHFVLQQQHKMGSPDVVSLREGLGTSDGPANIARQEPVKYFQNLVKKFDFNLIISNPNGSSNIKLVFTLVTCTASQKARTKRQ